uniref:Bloodthirsty n=1 Tax=Gadus morhua TaxID=8049 RepID=A0A8C5CR71_GADMO
MHKLCFLCLGMASATSWSEENFSCPICLDVFSSPVTTPCGHNFCRACVTKFWDEQVQYKCPVCNEVFHTRPDVRVNTFISEVTAQFRTSVRVKEQPCVEPGEVPCDVCIGTQLKAVKSCLECFTSYCHTHLEPHQRVRGLKKHQLVEPMDRLEERMCKKHERLLELFCRTEQECVCQFCTEGDHRSHPVVPLKEEYEVKMAQLAKIEEMIQERKLKIKETNDTVELSKKDADRELASGLQVYTALICCVQKCRDDFDQMVKEKLKSTEKQAEDLIRELEQEIEDLTNRSAEVKPLSQTKDHLHFLQAFRSLKDPPPTRDWTTVKVSPPSYVETLKSSLDQLEETLNMEMKKLSSPAELKRVQQYEVAVTLDPDTAHPLLTVSEDGKQVHNRGRVQTLSVNPRRFSCYPLVFSRHCFYSPKFYFEVQVKGTYWRLGVARDNIDRKVKAGIFSNPFTPKNGYWMISSNNNEFVFNDVRNVHLPLRAKLQKVGVFVDHAEGLVSFYDVEARIIIYSATGYNFRGNLFPLLSPCSLVAFGGNPEPLILSPVNQTD